MSRENPRRASATRTRTAEVQSQIDALEREFERLERGAELDAVQSAISRIEERLTEFPADLKALRRRGYQHGRSMDERLALLTSQWRKTAPTLNNSLRLNKNRLRSAASGTSTMVKRAASGHQNHLSSAESAIDGLEKKIDAAEDELRNLYSNIDSELYAVDSELRRVEWMMDALEESAEIRLHRGEGPLLAVKTEWHRDGDEGPEGVLFLTDQRLLFEQREEVVTKKHFGFLKAESEMVNKLWLDINITDIDSVEDSEEGGFLGIGKDDILDITCKGQAPVSRARFHLKGQDSADWRAQIRRALSGDQAAERYQRASSTPKLSFPTQCPHCTAPLPEPHRGASQVKCEFCGSSIGPEQ